MVRTIVSIAVSLPFILQLTANTDPGRTVIPIQKIGNLLLAKATVNGKTGNFIIDTGAPGLYLNANHFEGREFSEVQVNSVNGEVQEIGLKQAKLNLFGIKRNFAAIVIDLSKIEVARKTEILGLLGYSIFKKYEMVLDLLHLKIELIELDRKGNRLYDYPEAPTDIIPFKTKRHFPVIQAKVGGTNLSLGLDTGAECNVVALNYQMQLLKNSHDIHDVAVTSVEKRDGQNRIAQVKNWQFNGIHFYPMMTIFTDMSRVRKLTDGKALDGLLGVPFMVQFKMAINFKQKKLLLWDHRNGASAPLVAREDPN